MFLFVCFAFMTSRPFWWSRNKNSWRCLRNTFHTHPYFCTLNLSLCDTSDAPSASDGKIRGWGVTQDSLPLMFEKMPPDSSIGQQTASTWWVQCHQFFLLRWAWMLVGVFIQYFMLCSHCKSVYLNITTWDITGFFGNLCVSKQITYSSGCTFLERLIGVIYFHTVFPFFDNLMSMFRMEYWLTMQYSVYYRC